VDITTLKNFTSQVLTDHKPMMSLYQTIADNFYPERADFTLRRNVGDEMTSGLTESVPVLLRRDLGDSISAMLRDGDWFNISIDGEPDRAGRDWLQWATKRLRTFMYDREAGFVRATKEADHDFITFGPAVISCERNRKANGLLFRTWHLRDCAWWENESGHVCGVVRKWEPDYNILKRYFGDKNHKDVEKAQGKDLFKKGDIIHVCMPSAEYGKDEFMKYPYVSAFVDRKHDIILEEIGLNRNMYQVPRFKTIPNSPYAYSPSTIIGLPDARSVQEMQATLLDAGERYTAPPIIATEKVIRSDVDLSANGITWVDADYDEKMGAALRPLATDKGGYPIGLEVRDRQVEILKQAFFADRLSLLNDGKERTAFEVSELMKQYRRQNLPLFEPIEEEYNGQICEHAFDICLRSGFLGSPMDIPDSLRGRDVVFKFKSPISDAEEEKKVQMFSAMMDMTERASAIDPTVAVNVNVDQALRDAIDGAGIPERWKVDEKEALKRKEMLIQQATASQAQAGAE